MIYATGLVAEVSFLGKGFTDDTCFGVQRIQAPSALRRSSIKVRKISLRA